MKTTAAVLGSILLSLPSYAAPSVKGIAAYCGQFKDYNQQQQCFQDEAQTAGKEIKERCKRFLRAEDQLTCTRDVLQSEAGKKNPNPPYCLPIKESDIRRIKTGQPVFIGGIDGCSMLFNR